MMHVEIRWETNPLGKKVLPTDNYHLFI